MGWGRKNRGARLNGREQLVGRLKPLSSGLIAAIALVLTLVATLVLAKQDEALLAGPGPAASHTVAVSVAAPPPLLTTRAPSPQPTRTRSVTPTLSPSPSPTRSEPSPTPVSPTPTITPSPSPFPTRTPRPASRSVSAPAARCTRPGGWFKYTVRRGDTLSAMASRCGVSVTKLKKVNCLKRNTIVRGATLWVPCRISKPPRPPAPTRKPKPSATYTPVPYGGAIVVPPQLAGESPLPAAHSQVRMLSVVATILLLILLAAAKLAANLHKHFAPSHGLQRYATNEQHEAGSVSRW
jgi:hypothetical protein